VRVKIPYCAINSAETKLIKEKYFVEKQKKTFCEKKKKKNISVKKKKKKKRFHHLAISKLIFTIDPGESAGMNLENTVASKNL